MLRLMIVQDDVLGLSDTPPRVLLQLAPPGRFAFPLDVAGKADAFAVWLRGALDSELLEIVGGLPSGWQNKYVRAAYSSGVEFADAALRGQGLAPLPGALGATFNAPIHVSKLQLLYSRNFRELRGITNAVEQSLTRIVTEGLATGASPRVVARDITRSISTIGRNRSRVLARTEVIRAHATATITRYQQAGVTEVVGMAEFATAGDDRVSNCKWSLIETDTGPRPIAGIRPGDFVLTRDGYKTVVATSVRGYRGPMVRIVTAHGTELCTAEHPIFVRGSGWVDASEIKIGDVLEAPGNQAVDILSVHHFNIGDAANAPTFSFKVRSFLGVLLGVLVPVDTIYFQRHLDGGQEKVDLTRSHFPLLDVLEAETVQAFTHLALQARFAPKGAGTSDGAESGLVSFLTMLKRRATLQAIAFLDAVAPSRSPSAPDRAIGVALLVSSSDGECLTAPRTELGHSVPVSAHLDVAGPRTESVSVGLGVRPISLTAALAFDIGHLAFPGPIAALGAKDVRCPGIFARVRATC